MGRIGRGKGEEEQIQVRGKRQMEVWRENMQTQVLEKNRIMEARKK